ncbi:MAG: Rpn family recombination-promoting nuclease/putative transposase [Defluviitaleaceae bacterium]|nr:Rpn family recombination-promoting nuclease/putative transposase [Defluviitaleaceae bacterium]
MTKLQYKLTNDILFKMLFVKYPELLKKLVAELLSIQYTDIEQFDITNQEIPPETLGDKFCRLDINMIVNGQRVDLEIQVENEGNYPERSLFIWAREFSTSISEGQDYALLPRTIVISILGFKQFSDPNKFHSEFQVLEVSSHEPLTDKCVLHFFELPKLSKDVNTVCGKELWLKLFKAETEEDLEKLENLGVETMSEAVKAYRHVSASSEFREIERIRSKARHDEAQALQNARKLERQLADEEWQSVVAEVTAEKDAIIAKLQAQLGKQPL